MMDKTKQPGINFNGILLVEEKFWRNHEVPDNPEILFDIEMNLNIQEENCNTQLISTLIMKNETEEVLKLESTFVGLFSINKENENMDMEHYLKNNSPALMFPYIREHIAMITQKSGVGPVLLPPMNIIALINKNNPD